MLKEISEEYMKEFEPSNKLALISTIDSEGYPHITLISSLQAKDKNEMIWGQFIEGLSKKHVLKNPKTGFFIMNFNKEFWRGRAVWTHYAKEGPEYIMFNEKPLYRYNTYTGIHTVHYMDLIDITEKKKLNMAAIGYGTLYTRVLKGNFKKDGTERILNNFSEGLFNKIDSLKFISYIDDEGFPAIIPIIQASSAGNGRIAFSKTPFNSEIKKIPNGAKTAVFGMTLEMEDVLLKGIYSSTKRIGAFDIDKVYNSMPPVMGYIYPRQEIKKVEEF
jgi:hypothetical protein